MNLRTPGPTPIPPQVAEALSRPMINHRGPEFEELFAEVVANLQRVFQTRHEVLVLTASGTGGLEAAVANLFSPGDRVLAVSIGNFGDRFAQIAAAYGLDVQRLRFPNGHAADPAAIADRLRADPTIKGVLVTHNETATGVTNDIEAIARAVQDAGAPLLVVDGISSVGSLDVRPDEWGIDVLIAGSQKGWMVPPGLTMLSVSPRAWEAHRQARLPRYYFDFTAAHKSAQKHQTPWTPAVSLLYAFREALRLMLAEGLPALFERHRRIGAHTRAGLRGLGLRLVPVDERYASNTVTAFWLPEGCAADSVQERLRAEYGVVLAEGQGELHGKILRIGHMGYVSEADIDAVLQALSRVLPAQAAARP
ncbi:MAG TPA: alanine--glyoxylate aminotransferase family protein [Chloroflexota bacterium]|nr:alanine--glyoxylate aminotransferase family protein [Chloroflexota bacterium]